MTLLMTALGPNFRNAWACQKFCQICHQSHNFWPEEKQLTHLGINFTKILRVDFSYKRGFFEDFICLQFEFVIFWCKEIGAKAAWKNVGEIDYIFLPKNWKVKLNKKLLCKKLQVSFQYSKFRTIIAVRPYSHELWRLT